ncbi:bifunctional ADP-dependent NAD(P)H-hydrate dehydratase/NAD(P)H-hydrate epimerase [Janthinobacterium psychrotolerans]|uniref:Bifunctional NAD(P)H-hydrate repair enzyme n=1 Tax=Janthinobacterium psychrotolerans TaxID=1747903 RepID=A0A1A7BWD5_9BURK|nr:bifunctional ADP-dependent NAD(P)H-hydrate dehydratase/NAD(P)H-hydrate epimerase [Janthinobacterium psychrotolerans]OBV37822.1 yjeF C-terminal region, hydroxyethylthiazole kinase-related/yjeF N-terminal region [Janthinobacterium psychrotolerans]
MTPLATATPLYSIAEIRAIETAATQSLPQGVLMARAGQAAASAALKILHHLSDGDAAHMRVLVLAGPGNNGGDALEAAAHLAGSGIEVLVWLAPEAASTSPEREQAASRARNSAARFIDGATTMASSAINAAPWHLIIDGLFGIGATRPLTGVCGEMAQLVNQQSCPVLALDVPSGLHADTGTVEGVAIRATHTITFIGDKPGLHTADGRDHAGEVEVAALAIAPALLPQAGAQLNGVHLFARHLQPRRQNTHKGSYGSVAVLGGATGMSGAPVLAARAALHAGAGRVTIGFPDAPLAYDSGQPELMCRRARDIDFTGLQFGALVAGPGLGGDTDSVELLQRAIDSDSALLLDADALNLMAAEPELQSALATRSGAGATILTPHPLEAARLLDMTVAEVQADRLACARQLAAQLGVIVVLKGSGTVIAAQDGGVVINNTGSPALSTAGTGDVLAGLCGSLLAQGWPEWEAALGAVWLHGAAADALVASGAGPIGLTAGELIPALRKLINALSA